MRASNSSEGSTYRDKFKKEYLGNYLGIVVQNNDPSKQGRVKIYVPSVSSTVYDKWYKPELDDNGKLQQTDKTFSFIGRNVNSDLTDIIDTLKEKLPWAKCAAPLVGASSSGRYNAHLETGSVSDSSKIETTTKDTSTAFTKYGLNSDGIGEKPARIYEVKELEVHDAYHNNTDGEDNSKPGSPNKINKLSYQYKPSSYSNQAKGSFSIPNVGSHVWVFFENGDPMNPVYFASSFGEQDWKQIYDSDETHGVDYPGAYENKSTLDDPTYNHNTETYRNKYVLSQKGGAIEIVNTDGRENIKLTHYSGSFKEFNNESNIEFAVNQDQKLVQGDQFLTVNGHQNLYTELDLDQIVRGDYYKKIGTFNYEKFDEWQEEVRFISDLKQLFEVKRAKYLEDNENILVQKISPIQDKSPINKEGHAPCPVCSHVDRPAIWEVKNEGPLIRLPSISTIANFAIGVATGFIAPIGLPTPFPLKQPEANPGNFLGNGNCPACGGDGLSPSTFGGSFDSQDKNDLISAELENRIENLTKIEKDLGIGGSEIINITKHKVENIGLLMNDFPSIRVDDIGKLVPNELVVLKEGVVLNQKAVPLIEYVHVDEMPGGSYTLNCANKFNVHAGSNGISFKTYGPVDIGGTIVNVGGEQVNIASDNEVNINAGRVSIIADILSMRQREYKQVLIESNLGVAGNAIVRGSLHVEGELSVEHITAPMEMKETDQNVAYGEVLPLRIGTAIVNGGSSAGAWAVYGFGSSPMCVRTYKHSHNYEGIASSGLKSSDDVRIMGQNTGARMPSSPIPVEHGGFLTKLTDKLGDTLSNYLPEYNI